MKKVAVFLLFIFFFNSYSQDANLTIGKEEKTELTFQKYDSLIIKKDYIKLEDIKNDTSENLIKSTLSATSQEWIDYNTLGGSLKSTKKKVDYFEKIKNMNKEKNYIQLIHKISFSIDNIPTEIIKFYFKQEGQEKTSGCYVVQKVNNRWYRVSSETTSNLSIIIMRLKTDILIQMFSGKISDVKVKKIHDLVCSNKTFDLRKLEKVFFSWYSPIKNKEMLNLFIDPKTW